MFVLFMALLMGSVNLGFSHRVAPVGPQPTKSGIVSVSDPIPTPLGGFRRH